MLRKIDSCGRIQIPIKVRDQYHLDSGTEVEIESMLENGHLILRVDCGDVVDTIRAMAEAAGLKISE